MKNKRRRWLNPVSSYLIRPSQLALLQKWEAFEVEYPGKCLALQVIVVNLSATAQIDNFQVIIVFYKDSFKTLFPVLVQKEHDAVSKIVRNQLETQFCWSICTIILRAI